MSTSELPEPWGAALSAKGVHSYRDLASKLDVAVGTAHRLVTGDTSATTAQKAADMFFDGDVNVVWEMRGESRRGYGPWEPPDAAHFLTPKQRRAVEAVIAAMVPDESEGVGRGNAAPTSAPDSGPGLKIVEDDIAARESKKHPRRGPKGDRGQ